MYISKLHNNKGIKVVDAKYIANRLRQEIKNLINTKSEILSIREKQATKMKINYVHINNKSENKIGTNFDNIKTLNLSMKMNQHLQPDKILKNVHPSQLLALEVPKLPQINHNHLHHNNNNNNNNISSINQLYHHRNNLSTTTTTTRTTPTTTINYDALIFALADRFIENNGNLNINLNTSSNLNSNTNNNKNYVNNGNGPSVMYNYGPSHGATTRINFIPTNNGNILSNLPFIITPRHSPY